jgi:multidrug efflux pump subunit AcrA (membrane-fusion protein)
VWERQCLAEIPDLSTIVVLSQVSEEDVSKVFIGQEAHITTDAFKDLEIKAKVSRIGMAAILRYASPAGSLSQSIEDTGQKVFELDLAPEKTDSRLRPGMTANISIILETLPNALTLPVSAVFRKEGRSVVYLATKDGYKVQPVTLGRSNRERVEILSGLKENDEVFKKDLSQMENKS